MSHFAAAVVRDVNGWTAAELDITGAADVDDVAERLRDIDPNAKVSLLFVESDDTFLAIVRLDEGDDPRVFGSDPAFATESRIGAVLLADPVGDVDILADLGVPAPRLLALCGREGMLPSDVTAEVCQLVGCGDEIEELRDA